MDIIERHLSGGHNDREIDPEGVVIHYASARYTQSEDPYDVDEIIRILDENDLAYHYLIGRDGDVYELVPPPLRAWHAGESEWEGRGDCNSWMLGISLAGKYGESFTDRQYDSLAELTGRLVKGFPSIRKDCVTGHEDVAPDRKKDPGPSFDWDRYRHAIGGLWKPK